MVLMCFLIPDLLFAANELNSEYRRYALGTVEHEHTY